MGVPAFRRIAISAGAILAVVVCWFAFKSYTDPILARHAVARLHALTVNGGRQWLLERGCDRRKPVLLFLHGGPGMPAMFTAHVFGRPLERDFVVVNWDERGAGKSYHADLDPATMTFTQMEADALEVVRHLRESYHVPRVFLAGHSWGSFLGAHLAAEHPDLFWAFVAVGADTDQAAQHTVQDRLIRQWFEARGMKAPAVTSANREELLFRTGGELARATSMWPLIRTGLLAPEYSLKNGLDIAKGPRFAQKYLRYDIPGGYGMLPERFAIPVFVVMGSGDTVTPVSLARKWFDRLQAPKKAWFEVTDAAHFPHFERPAAFADIMLQIQRQTGVKVSDEPAHALPVPRFGLQCL